MLLCVQGDLAESCIDSGKAYSALTVERLPLIPTMFTADQVFSRVLSAIAPGQAVAASVYVCTILYTF